MSNFNNASLIVTPNSYKAGKLYSIKPTSGAGDLDVVCATSATRINANGLIEVVGNNIPRLDYTNASCPSILVEPQRTNLVLRSQEFNNVAWLKTNTTISADSSTTTDPIGGNSADALFETTTNAFHSVMTSSIVTAASNGTSYTFSVYLKANNRTKGYLSVVNGGGFSTFDLTAKTNVFGGNGTNETVTGQKITELANGWFRLSITSTFSGAANVRPVVGINNDAGVSSYAGDTTKGFFIWGAQLEAGANATSYIPTTTTTVTRNADVISKSGISDLIGQTEGTIFIDFNNTKIDSVSRYIYAISNGNSTDSNLEAVISNSNNLIISSRNNGVTQVSYNYGILSLQKYKIAYSYSENNTRIFVNGVLVSVDTICTIPTTDSVKLGMRSNTTSPLNDSINKLLLFKTQLTDQECIDLTTL